MDGEFEHMEIGQGADFQGAPRQGRGRGQGRGGRGRGRGRGAGRGAGRANQPLPSAAQRAAQLGVPSATPSESGRDPPTLSALSKIIEDQYPVTSVNTDNLSTYIVDPTGYINLAISTYNQVLLQWRHLTDYLSQQEFLLVAGWALAYRVIKIRAKMGFVFPEHSEFLHCMPEIVLPGPLSEYLNTLGLIELPDHTKVFPDLVIPCGILGNNALFHGMVPIRLSMWDSFAVNNLPQVVLMAHMYPFGLIRRSFERHVGPPANANHYLDQFDPANGGPLDGWLSRPYVLACNPSNLGVPSGARQAANVFANTYDSDTFTGSVMFNPDILANYNIVAGMMVKYVYMGTASESTKGSLAQVAYTTYVPRVNFGTVDSMMFRTAVDLSQAEMHAARTFQFRRRITNVHCIGANGEDVDLALTIGPSLIRTNAPIFMTELKSLQVYFNYVSSLFIKQKIDK